MTLVRSTLAVLKCNFQHRSLLADLIRRDFKLRYLGSLLGGYWCFIHPLAMIAIYTIIFAQVFKVRLGAALFESPYAYTLYICAGMLPWTAFTEMVSRSTAIFQEHGNLVKKVQFPKEVLTPIAIGSNTITLFLSLILYSLLLILSGHGVSWLLLLIPVVMALQVVFACGLGMILSILNVFFRDIQQVLPIVFQIWFWLTPLVYTLERVPERFHKFFLLNPFFYFSTLFQDLLFYQRLPKPEHFILGALLAAGTFALGAALLQHFKDQISDEL